MFFLVAVAVAIYALTAPWIFHIFFPAYNASIPFTQVYSLSFFGLIKRSSPIRPSFQKKTKALYILSFVNPAIRTILLAVFMYYFSVWGIFGRKSLPKFHLDSALHGFFGHKKHKNMKCRFCKTILKDVFIDLGNSPASNSFLTTGTIERTGNFFPFKVYVCGACFLVQVDEYKKTETIFNDEYAIFFVLFDKFSRAFKKICRHDDGTFRLRQKITSH